MSTEQDPLDMQNQLKARIWAGEYYSEGRPIVRLLADLAITTARKMIGEDDARS